MAHGDAREGKWRGNWRMEWVASTLHTTWEHGVPSITTADAHTSVASGRLNWRPRRFKWTRPFCRKTKYGFCVCAITFQMHSTTHPANIGTFQSLTTAVWNNWYFQSVYSRRTLSCPYQHHSSSPPHCARHAHPIVHPPDAGQGWLLGMWSVNIRCRIFFSWRVSS